jgi:hypothetical protein
MKDIIKEGVEICERFQSESSKLLQKMFTGEIEFAGLHKLPKENDFFSNIYQAEGKLYGTWQGTKYELTRLKTVHTEFDSCWIGWKSEEELLDIFRDCIREYMQVATDYHIFSQPTLSVHSECYMINLFVFGLVGKEVVDDVENG